MQINFTQISNFQKRGGEIARTLLCFKKIQPYSIYASDNGFPLPHFPSLPTPNTHHVPNLLFSTGLFRELVSASAFLELKSVGTIFKVSGKV